MNLSSYNITKYTNTSRKLKKTLIIENFNLRTYYLSKIRIMPANLPCVRCGSSLSLVEGSLVQCFNCGTKNVYTESLDLFDAMLLEILNITATDQTNVNITNEELERRKKAVESCYHDLNAQFYSQQYLIATKLDSFELDSKTLLETLRKAGCFEIIIEEYILPNLKESFSKNQFQEISALSHIFNKILLGLYFSEQSRQKFELEDCAKYYQFAERNYRSVVNYCDTIKLINPSFNVPSKIILASVLADFSVILRNVLTENATYSTEEFEKLFKELDKIKEKNIQILNLWAQIEKIYNLGRDTSLLLEELRLGDPFSTINLESDNFIYNAEENLENLELIKEWIEETSEKYQGYQKRLLRLHSGRFIDYLETYRIEFSNRRNKNIEKYDDLVEKIINKTIVNYNLETVEVLDILSDFIRKKELDLSKETILRRFEIEHDDLTKLDESLKNFITRCFDKTIMRNLAEEYYSNLISIIAEKHSEFDRYILKYVSHLLKEFEDYRTEKALSLEEQRNYLSLDLKPSLKRLVEASFTLQDELIAYPILLDVIILSKTLTVYNPETITVLIENPGLLDIKNVNVSFFMPNSFQSKLRFAQLKKIKAQDGRKIETEVVPTEKGIYHFMVMVEYQSSGIKETFWMPSIKIELEVEEEF